MFDDEDDFDSVFRTREERRRWADICIPRLADHITHVNTDPYSPHLTELNRSNPPHDILGSVLAFCDDRTWVALCTHPDADIRCRAWDNDSVRDRDLRNIGTVPELTRNDPHTEQAICAAAGTNLNRFAALILDNELAVTTPLVRHWLRHTPDITAAGTLTALLHVTDTQGITPQAAALLLRSGSTEPWTTERGHDAPLPADMYAAHADTLTLPMCWQLFTASGTYWQHHIVVERRLDNLLNDPATRTITFQVDYLPGHWWWRHNHTTLLHIATDRAVGEALLAGITITDADAVARGHDAIRQAAADGTIDRWNEFGTISTERANQVDTLMVAAAHINWSEALTGPDADTWRPAIIRTVLQAGFSGDELRVALELTESAASLDMLRDVVAGVTG
jgi:hypothetical protein